MSSENQETKNVKMTPAFDSEKVPFIALIVGVVGILIGAAGMAWGLANGDSRPWLSWLIGLAFWMSILIGSLLFIMITYAFDAGWSIIIRRQLEHLTSAFPWMALLFFAINRATLALGLSRVTMEMDGYFKGSIEWSHHWA